MNLLSAGSARSVRDLLHTTSHARAYPLAKRTSAHFASIGQSILLMRLLDKALLIAANRMIKDFGQLTALQVNTKEHSAFAIMMLAGETKPIEVNVGRYELLRDDKKVTVQLRDVSCSREWMHQLARRLEPQMHFDLPPALSSALRFAGIL